MTVGAGLGQEMRGITLVEVMLGQTRLNARVLPHDSTARLPMPRCSKHHRGKERGNKVFEYRKFIA